MRPNRMIGTGLAAVVLAAGVLVSPAQAAGGHLDPTFDGDGRVTTGFRPGSSDSASAVVRQSDGKLVAAGGTRPLGSDLDFALVRYNVDGSVDTTFGGDGMVTTEFLFQDDIANAVIIQPDGKIVVAGTVTELVEEHEEFRLSRHYGVARYNPNGTLDSTFGGGGKVVSDGNPALGLDLLLQPDGKLVVAGSVLEEGATGFFLVDRLMSDGSRDTTFGHLGRATTSAGGLESQATAIILQPDGKLVAAGATNPLNTTTRDFALARFNGDGTLDPTFGAGGTVTTDFATSTDEANDVVVLPDGKLVAAGSTRVGTNTENFALARYNPNGTLAVRNERVATEGRPGPVKIRKTFSSTFDDDGLVTTDFGGTMDVARALVLQPDGMLVAAGSAAVPGGNSDFALARYRANGRLDPTFNGDGKATTDFDGDFDSASGLLIQPDGKLVAAGTAKVGGIVQFGLARYGEPVRVKRNIKG